MTQRLFQLHIDLMPNTGDDVPNHKKPRSMHHALLIGKGPTGTGIYLKLGAGFLQIEDLEENHPLLSFSGDYQIQCMPPDLNNLVCPFIQPGTNYGEIMESWALSNYKKPKDVLPETKAKNRRNAAVRDKLATQGIELPPRKSI